MCVQPYLKYQSRPSSVYPQTFICIPSANQCAYAYTLNINFHPYIHPSSTSHHPYASHDPPPLLPTHIFTTSPTCTTRYTTYTTFVSFLYTPDIANSTNMSHDSTILLLIHYALLRYTYTFSYDCFCMLMKQSKSTGCSHTSIVEIK